MARDTTRQVIHVDRSKPSTACEPCRKTRSKCDRQRPYCSQCVRKSRVCSGYRDSFDLRLRDESNKIQLREGRKRSSLSASTSSTSSASSTSSSRTNTPPPDSGKKVETMQLNYCSFALALDQRQINVPAKLSQPVSVVAANFFLTSFACGFYVDYLPYFYGSNVRSEVLEASFDAMALSYLAKCKNSPDLSDRALHKYSTALQKTTEALSTTMTAAQDDMVASVMLLALFAAFSCDPSDAARTWTNHIDGAMILMSMRQPGSFSDVRSQLLLNHVISAIQLNCFRRKISFPSQLSRLYELSWQANDLFWQRFWSLLEDVARLIESSVRGKTGHRDMVERAWELDIRTVNMLDAMPAWEANGVYPGMPAYKFYDNRSIRANNACKMVRLELNSLLVSQGKLHLATSPDIDEMSRDQLNARLLSAKVSVNLIVNEIYNSMPLSLAQDQLEEYYDINKTIWIFSFVWPLAMAIDTNMLTADMEQRIRSQLRRFAKLTDNVDVARIATLAAEGGSAQNCVPALFFC